MTQKHEILNGPCFGFRFSALGISFVSDFDIRISDFGWRRLGTPSFADVVLLNIEKVKF